MSEILDIIKSDSVQARRELIKDKNEVAKCKANLLVTLYSEAVNVGKNDGNRDTTDAEVISVIQKFIKNAEETSNNLQDTDPRKVVAIVEIGILKEYLPKQLTKEEILGIVEKLHDTEGLLKMGYVMTYFKTTYPGKYDGKMLSESLRSSDFVQK